MRTLKPIYDRDSYSAELSKFLYSFFYAEIFAPLFLILDLPAGRRNDKSTSLEDALRSGRLFYQDGFFVGPLTAALSKQLRGIGAVYNKTRKSYQLNVSAIPLNIKLAISEGNLAAKNKLTRVQDFLTAKEGSDIPDLDLEPFFGMTIGKLNDQFDSTVVKKMTGENLEIPLALQYSEAMRVGYTENLNKYIKDWHQEQILKLREKITANVVAGYRADALISTIQEQRGVTQRKAKFLARQETSLLVSKYREVRYKDAGLNSYVWSTSHDERVRPDHKVLNGSVFRYDHPPVTDRRTGAKNNPGEDFNCRCVAIPVLTTADTLMVQK